MKNKRLGLAVIVISVVLLFTLGFLIYQIKTQVGGLTCPIEQDGKICPYHLLYNLALPIYFMFFVSVIIFLVGLYLFTRKEVAVKGVEEQEPQKTKEVKTLDLTPEEKTVFELIQATGTIFQSELAEKTQFSKVKITRILDRLEGKGLVERRRRGMTNIVILKN